LLDSLIDIAIRYKDRIDTALFLPRVNWRQARNDRRVEKPVLAKTAP
jgi:UDP-sulfoquinovose synthase